MVYRTTWAKAYTSENIIWKVTYNPIRDANFWSQKTQTLFLTHVYNLRQDHKWQLECPPSKSGS